MKNNISVGEFLDNAVNTGEITYMEYVFICARYGWLPF